jgi:hypothetical protein
MFMIGRVLVAFALIFTPVTPLRTDLPLTSKICDFLVETVLVRIRNID